MAAKHSATRCPNCNKPLIISTTVQPSERGGWTRKPMMESTQLSLSKFGGISAPVMGAGDWEKVTPIGRLNTEDVLTALFDASVSCLLVTVGTGFAILITNYRTPYYIEWWLAPGAGLIVGLFRYFGGMSLAKGLLQTVESIISKDIDGDGVIGQPDTSTSSVPHVVKVELEERRNEGKTWQYADLIIEPPKLIALSKAVMAGESFSERTATGEGFTQKEWGEVRDQFLDRNWAVWNHPTRKQQGVSLTIRGTKVLKAISTTSLPDSLSQNGGYSSTQQHAARDFEFIEEVN